MYWPQQEKCCWETPDVNLVDFFLVCIAWWKLFSAEMKEDSHQLNPNYLLMHTSAGESLTRDGWNWVLTGFLHLISRTGSPNHTVACHQQVCLWSYFWTFKRSGSMAQTAKGELSNYWDESLESQAPMASHKCCSEIYPLTIMKLILMLFKPL